MNLYCSLEIDVFIVFLNMSIIHWLTFEIDGDLPYNFLQFFPCPTWCYAPLFLDYWLIGTETEKQLPKPPFLIQQTIVSPSLSVCLSGFFFFPFIHFIAKCNLFVGKLIFLSMQFCEILQMHIVKLPQAGCKSV